jgi:hypothetical protein
MAETAFSAVEHALENQPVGGLQIRECGFGSRPDLHQSLDFPHFWLGGGVSTLGGQISTFRPPLASPAGGNATGINLAEIGHSLGVQDQDRGNERGNLIT